MSGTDYVLTRLKRTIAAGVSKRGGGISIKTKVNKNNGQNIEIF